jgi:hypothetical protein
MPNGKIQMPIADLLDSWVGYRQKGKVLLEEPVILILKDQTEL